MHVLAIGASARLQGNSNGLMRLAVESVQERGVTADVIYARRLAIQGCLGCNECKRSPEATCVVKDDMHDLYRRLDQCDALVLATPVYFYGMNSWLKAIVDRTYGLLDPDYAPRIATGKRFYVITTEEEEDSFTGRDIAKTLTRALGWFGMELAGELIAVRLHDDHDWELRPDYIEAARALIDAP